MASGASSDTFSIDTSTPKHATDVFGSSPFPVWIGHANGDGRTMLAGSSAIRLDLSAIADSESGLVSIRVCGGMTPNSDSIAAC